MNVRINCKFNDGGAWCKCPDIKRKLFGIGARLCRVYEGKSCQYQVEYKKPKHSPAPPTPEDPKPIQDQYTMAMSLFNLRTEMGECGNMEIYFKINSCLYSKYPHTNEGGQK